MISLEQKPPLHQDAALVWELCQKSPSHQSLPARAWFSSAPLGMVGSLFWSRDLKWFCSKICDGCGFRVSDRKYFSGADDLIQQLWIQIALWPVILLPEHFTLPSLSLFTGNMSALGQGLIITLHLHNVQGSEPPPTWAMQVNTTVPEGDNAVDECREICRINTCPKFCVCEPHCAAATLSFPWPFLLSAGRSGFMSLLWYCIFKDSCVFG